MMITEVIILILTGIAALIVQNIYFIIDDREANHTARDRRIKKYWHWAGGVIHAWMGYAVYRITNDWRWGYLMGAFTWSMFDGFINTYVLQREWWFVGDTALLDITQRKIAGFLHIEHRLFSAFLKLAVLISSFVLLIPKYL